MTAYSSSFLPSLSLLFFTTLLISALPPLAGCGGKVVVEGLSDKVGVGGGSSVSVGSGEPPLATCGPKENTIVGTIDGAPLSVSVPLTGAGQMEGLLVLGAEQGMQMIFLSSSPPDGGTRHTDVGFLRIPVVTTDLPSPPSAHQGLWICDETGPTVTGPPGQLTIDPVSFAALRSLGTCPGKPVSGELKICGSGVGCAVSSIEGTIGGQPLVIAGYGGFGNEKMFAGRGVIAPGTDITDSYVLLMPDGSADPGALYCVGSVTGAPGSSDLVLGDFSRLGTCAEATPIAGSVSVCVGPT